MSELRSFMGIQENNQKGLKIDWCTYEAAKFACLNWHYSKSIPVSKIVKIGVWEDDVFKGAVLFSRGATPMIGRPYNLKQTEICELTRIALRDHKTPVSRIVAISVKFLKKNSPGLRLVISYADVDQGHLGKIYQASNWVYEGLCGAGTGGYFLIRGQKVHSRSIHSKYGTGSQSLEWIRRHLDPDAKPYRTSGKHKYCLILDDSLRDTITKRSKPYPRVNGSAVERPDSIREAAVQIRP